MNRHCHHCGCEWTLREPPGRNDACPECKSDLKVCLNCTFYDAQCAYQCRERRAEPVMEKHTANFCEYFDFARRAWAPKPEGNSREQSAREQLKKLLG
jgi:hypothetical protein